MSDTNGKERRDGKMDEFAQLVSDANVYPNPYDNPTHDWFDGLDEDRVEEALAHARSLMQLDTHESVLVQYYTNNGREPLTDEDREDLAQSRLADVLSLILDGSIIVGGSRFESPPSDVNIGDVAWLIIQQEEDEEQYYEDQRLIHGDEE